MSNISTIEPFLTTITRSAAKAGDRPAEFASLMQIIRPIPGPVTLNDEATVKAALLLTVDQEIHRLRVPTNGGGGSGGVTQAAVMARPLREALDKLGATVRIGTQTFYYRVATGRFFEIPSLEFREFVAWLLDLPKRARPLETLMDVFARDVQAGASLARQWGVDRLPQAVPTTRTNVDEPD